MILLISGISFSNEVSNREIHNPSQYTDTKFILKDSSDRISNDRSTQNISDTTVYFYYINSVPFDAQVIYKDSIIGLTPLRLFRDEQLTGKIMLRKEGYSEEQYDISIFLAGKSPDIILKQLEGFKDDVVLKDYSSGFRPKRNLIMIALSGAAAISGGVLANYFKDKANEDYDTYIRTLDKKYYNSANKLDNYSLISVIVMQAAIVSLIYFLFLEN